MILVSSYKYVADSQLILYKIEYSPTVLSRIKKIVCLALLSPHALNHSVLCLKRVILFEHGWHNWTDNSTGQGKET